MAWRTEVIVVDDQDHTPDILKKLQLEDQRLKIIEGQEPPTGWLGKPHALHLAQAHATGTCLLFVDADVALTTRGPLKTWQRMVEHEADVSSVLGRLETGSFFGISYNLDWAPCSQVGIHQCGQ